MPPIFWISRALRGASLSTLLFDMLLLALWMLHTTFHPFLLSFCLPTCCYLHYRYYCLLYSYYYGQNSLFFSHTTASLLASWTSSFLCTLTTLCISPSTLVTAFQNNFNFYSIFLLTYSLGFTTQLHTYSSSILLLPFTFILQAPYFFSTNSNFLRHFSGKFSCMPTSYPSSLSARCIYLFVN